MRLKLLYPNELIINNNREKFSMLRITTLLCIPCREYVNKNDTNDQLYDAKDY